MRGLSRRRFLHASAAVAALSPLGRAAWAQDAFPSRPIRLVVGFTPGTAADITARTFAAGAEGVLGQKIVVENRPGAGSELAAEYVARAAKDGYTLFLSTLSIVTAMRAAIGGGSVSTEQVANNWMRLVTAARPAISVKLSRL